MTTDTPNGDDHDRAGTGVEGAEVVPGRHAVLTAGVDMWHLAAAPDLGLRRIKVTDGPAGARGERWFGGSSACVPCGTALGATWSPATMAEVAEVLAAETRRKGADVLLAPTVNLHRHPLAGRNFECLSEDPELTAVLASALIGSLQSTGVSACVKHLVANDQETDRHDISAEVPEVALRELYLRPFEVAVRRGGAWAVMSAYNRLGGTHCSQHRWLLTELLRGEWGFDGLVVSDWFGTHELAAAAAGLDVEMPGPPNVLGPHVAEGIEAGTVPPAALERAVASVLRLAGRVGARVTPGTAVEAAPEASVDDPRDREVLRRAAVQSLVLLRNDVAPGTDGAPLVPLPQVSSVAVVGPNAATTAIMGGGSAAFVPHRSSDVLSALGNRLPPGTALTHARGTPLPDPLKPLQLALCRTGPAPDAPNGFVVEHHEGPEPTGEPILVEESLTGAVVWMLTPPAPGLPPGGTSVRLRTHMTPTRSGTHTFSLVTGTTGRLSIDGEVVVDNTEDREPGTAFMGLGSAEARAEVELTAGAPVELTAVTSPIEGIPVGGILIGHAEPEDPDPLAAAVAAARAADVAVVVVGGDDQWETEGRDRDGFELPGGQPELVRAVVAANPRTVVLVNCAAPVDLSFAEAAPALLQVWYPGQEAGEAICDVLLGTADPGGRLPTTFGRRLGDWSSDTDFPGADGTVTYAEGLRLGYRDFDSTGTEPAFCFGHGLSTTTFAWDGASLSAGTVGAGSVTEAAGGTTARVRVTNTGDRPGHEVVQCYLSPTAGQVVDPGRPPQHLAGFAKVHLAPGESAEVEVPIGWRALRRWAPGTGWVVPPGGWEVRLSASSRDHRLRLALEVTAD